MRDEVPFLYWNIRHELTWEDFQGDVPQGSPYASQSWSGLEVSAHCLEGKFTFDVLAVFRKDRSWVKDKKRTDELLGHEQGHFNISEIFARRLVKSFFELQDVCVDVDSTQEVVKQLTEVSKFDLDQMQERYDRETRNGRERELQQQWDEFIMNELNRLHAFKRTL